MKTKTKAGCILVIENEPEVLNLTSRVLELEGYHVLRATDGRGGYNMLCKNRVDLLLLDLQLPVFDGWTVLRRIKEQPSLSALPVVILTASADVSKREEALKLGATAYMVKPVNVPDLVGTVGHILNNDRDSGGSRAVTEAACTRS